MTTARRDGALLPWPRAAGAVAGARAPAGAPVGRADDAGGGSGTSGGVAMGTRPGAVRVSVHLEDGEERLPGDLHRPHLLHALLSLFLLFEEFALARDVAAVALGQDVLA